VLTYRVDTGRQSATPGPTHTASMKAILQATLAAILSGILVGVLLKKKVSRLGATES
jgi:hypothetical protein